MITLAAKLECARAVLAQMRDRKSRWTEAQEAAVKTIERAEMLEGVSVEIKGQPTQQVEVI